MAGADQDIAGFATVAGQLAQALHLWYVPLWRGMRALMRGDVGEAARLEAAAAELGDRAHSHNAVALVTTQRWIRQRQEGRLVDAAADLGAVLGFGPGATPLPQGADELRLRGVVAADGGDTAATARFVGQWAATALGDRSLDSEWLPETAQLAQLAVVVGDRAVAEVLFEQLSPYAERFCVEGIGAAFTGSVRWYLAALAGALGRGEDADRLRSAAVEDHRRVGLAVDPPAMASTDRAASSAPSGAHPAQVASLVHEGATWAITFRGVTHRVADAKGVRDLAVLLDRPDEEVHCLELAGGSDVGGAGGPVIDQQARRAYQDRIQELQEVVQDARAANDPYRAERAENELDALVAQLAAAFGLGGRERSAGAAAERARSTVTSRLRASMRKLGELQPDLRRHLDNAVRTGTWCAYRPEPGIAWRSTGRRVPRRERKTHALHGMPPDRAVTQEGTTMSRRRINGFDLYYERHGDGEPVVLVHGSWTDHLSWAFVVNELARTNQVVTYDRRGHSRASGARPRSFGASTRTTSSPWSRRSTSGRSTSSGAPTARRSPSAWPPDGPTSCAPSPPTSRPSSASPRPARRWPPTSSPSSARWRRPPPRSAGATPRPPPSGSSTSSPSARACGRSSRSRLARQWSPTLPTVIDLVDDPHWGEPPRLADIAAPVLLTDGTASPSWFRAIVEALTATADVTRHTFPDAGHAPHLTHPAEHVAVARSFIESTHPVTA